MPDRLRSVQIHVSAKVFVKDPHSSELGLQIIQRALPMIDELGMELFTFRKLAAEIGTTESAVYRYFENKHKLLLYYVSWYWGLVDYNLAFGTANISNAQDRLARAIQIITTSLKNLDNSPFELIVLQRVVVAESSKAYLTKQVDDENKEGLFVEFKQVMQRLSELISDVSPKYPFSHSLASLFVESHLNQVYFAEHLPSLSDLGNDRESRNEFYSDLIFKTIEPWQQ